MRSLPEILIDELHAVTRTEIQVAQNESRRTKERLEQALCRLGFVKEDTIAKALGNQYQLPVITDIAPSEIDLAWLHEHSSVEKASEDLFLPLRENGRRRFAVANPTDCHLFDLIRSIEGHTRGITVTTERAIHEALETLTNPPSSTDLEDLIARGQKEGAEGRAIEELLEHIMEEAIKRKATDVHIEPTLETTQVYLRIDGVRRPMVSLPSALHEGIINIIKVRADIKPDQHFTPDDKKFVFSYRGRREVDIRVSLLPSSCGPTVVNRILDRMSSLITLEDLGYSPKQFEMISGLTKCPNGLMLVTGPTGSGKTTTLYALLSKIASPEKKLITVEDPIEYSIPRVTQCQVREDRDFGFARALRSIVRHDPDIIMVGEIRDKETARIAMEASLTGHVVFSTLHTNSAVDTIVRLMDMGVPTVFIASTLRAVIAQRLVRRLCDSCKKEALLEQGSVERWGLRSTVAWEGRGCESCAMTGYKGRTVIVEILVIDHDIAQMIYEKQPAAALRRSAIQKGFTPLERDSIEKISNGITDLKEVENVLGAI